MSLSAALAHLDNDRQGALERLMDWVRIPSISTDSAWKADCARAADWLVADLRGLGFDASARPTPGHAVVVGHRRKAGCPHVLFYGHYDVQPVDPLNLWSDPPFEPQVKEIAPGRSLITGRGSADDKGQVMTFVEACRAFIAATGDLPLSVTVMVEGEEENGSLNLPAFIEANREELAADVALVCDTGMWDRETPAITAALRGMVYMEVKITCADRDLHSGLFGGAAANPIRVLSKALAGCTTTMAASRCRVLRRRPRAARADQGRLGGARADRGGFPGPGGPQAPGRREGPAADRDDPVAADLRRQRHLGRLHGEGTKTVIASEASAKVSFRLVGDQDPQKIIEAFEAYVRGAIPADCKAEFIRYKGSRAISLDWDMPALAKAEKALTAEWGRPAAIIGSGGSIPVVGDFKRTLGMDTLLVGFGLDDDRVHSPNEKYDLSSFQKGARSWARIIDALGK